MLFKNEFFLISSTLRRCGRLTPIIISFLIKRSINFLDNIFYVITVQYYFNVDNTARFASIDQYVRQHVCRRYFIDVALSKLSGKWRAALYCFTFPRLNREIPFDTREYLSKRGRAPTPLAAAWNPNAPFYQYSLLSTFHKDLASRVNVREPSYSAQIYLHVCIFFTIHFLSY